MTDSTLPPTERRIVLTPRDAAVAREAIQFAIRFNDLLAESGTSMGVGMRGRRAELERIAGLLDGAS